MQTCLGSAALAFAIWATWIRRNTFGFYAESDATLAMIAATVAVIGSPIIVRPLQRMLLRDFGIGHLGDFVENCCLLLVLCALLLHVAVRSTAPRSHARIRCRQRTILAVAVMPPLLGGMLILGLTAYYWLTLSVVECTVTLKLLFDLMEIRLDDRSRRVAYFYVTGALLVLMGNAFRVTALIEGNAYAEQTAVNSLACRYAAIIAFSIGTGWSWRRKQRAYREAVQSSSQTLSVVSD